MSQVAAARESIASFPVKQAPPAATQRAPGFHLFVESLERGASTTARAAADLPVLEVPAGVSYLSPGRDPLVLEARKPRATALLFEPVDKDAIGRPSLLLLSPAGLRVRLNGQALPALALLRTGDQLQLDARAILYVSEYRRRDVARPSAELVGRPCGVCRLPLTAETRVYVCGCGVPLHLEGPPKPESERLECALFGDCPSCGSEVHTESGHAWLPEL